MGRMKDENMEIGVFFKCVGKFWVEKFGVRSLILNFVADEVGD